MQVRIPADWLRDYLALMRTSLTMAEAAGLQNEPECETVRERIRDGETILKLAELSSDCSHGQARGFCNREGCAS